VRPIFRRHLSFGVNKVGSCLGRRFGRRSRLGDLGLSQRLFAAESSVACKLDGLRRYGCLSHLFGDHISRYRRRCRNGLPILLRLYGILQGARAGRFFLGRQPDGGTLARLAIRPHHTAECAPVTAVRLPALHFRHATARIWSIRALLANLDRHHLRATVREALSDLSGLDGFLEFQLPGPVRLVRIFHIVFVDFRHLTSRRLGSLGRDLSGAVRKPASRYASRAKASESLPGRRMPCTNRARPAAAPSSSALRTATIGNSPASARNFAPSPGLPSDASKSNAPFRAINHSRTF
jgi:hypothetical protein